MTLKEAFDLLTKDQKDLIIYLIFNGRKPRRKQNVKNRIPK